MPALPQAFGLREAAQRTVADRLAGAWAWEAGALVEGEACEEGAGDVVEGCRRTTVVLEKDAIESNV